MPFAGHELGLQWQFVRGETHSFSGIRAAYAFHLKQDLARTNDRDPMVRSSLTFTHTGFSRLLRDRLVREQPQPYFSATLDETRHGDTAGFDLTVSDVTALHHFQSEVAERQLRSAPGFAAHTSALLL